MRKTELEKYKKVLLDLKNRLNGMVRGMTSEALRPDDSPSVDHLADHGSDYFDQDLTLSLVENEQETIQAIDEALLRIEQGSYGDCEVCNSAIGKIRLDAVPYARLCLDCQENEDRLAG